MLEMKVSSSMLESRSCRVGEVKEGESMQVSQLT